MTDNEITEAYFRARGMEVPLLEIGLGVRERVNILESNSAFTEHVLEVMEGEGYRLDQVRGNVCRWLDESEHSRPRACYSEFIIDNNIFRAAVIAATRYWEGNK